MRARSGLIIIIGLVILGACLRLAHLGATGFWLDEILNVIHVAPEQGPLHHALVRLGVALGYEEAGVRLPFALVGIATIWLLYCAARTVLPQAESLLAAALLTVTPLHIYHSREVKPYALLVAGCTLAVWALLRLATETRGWRFAWRWHALFAIATLFLLLCSSNGVFYMGALITGYLVLILQAPTWRARLLTLACMAGISILVVVLFWQFYPHIVGSATTRTLLPRWDLIERLAQGLVAGYTEDRPPSMILGIALATAAVGVVALMVIRPAVGLMMALVCVLGFFIPLVILQTQGHGQAVRYELPALIPLIVLSAAGIGILCRATTRVVPWMPAVLMAVIGALAIRTQLPEIQRALHGTADWRQIAMVIKQHAHQGDVVITSNDWGHVCLDYYLPRVGANVRLENAQESIPRARQLMDASHQGFVIAGGFHSNRAIRDWLDAFPILATWRTEQITLSYFPDRAAYLTGRLLPQELQRDVQGFWETDAGQLTFTNNDDRFLLDGWSAAEQDHRQTSFRWVDGTHARIYLPVRDHSPRALRLRVMPFGATMPGQTLSVSLNGSPLVQVSLVPGWQEVSVPVSAGAWRYGANILAVDFSRATSPSQLNAGADPRHLSCAFSLLRAES